MDYVIYVLAFIGVLFLIFAIWVFRIYMDVQRNKKKPKGLEIMPFKDNEAAFEMASTMHSPVFSKNSMCIGIVRNIHTQNNSTSFIVELAGSNEPLYVMGFNDSHADSIMNNDLVYWGFVDDHGENILNIKAVGHMLAILKPEFNPIEKKWGVKKDLTQ